MSEISTYKLLLRHWLPLVIDSNKIPGLEWMDDTKTKFKVPWNFKDKSPNWEKEFELFKMWAMHRKREIKNWAQLKQNFRSALRNNEDFEEIKTENRLDHQSGNYRVYIIKSESELERNKSSSSPATSDSNDSTSTGDELSSPAKQVVSPTGQNSPSSDNLSEDLTSQVFEGPSSQSEVLDSSQSIEDLLEDLRLQVFDGPSSQSEAMECSQSFAANSNNCSAWNNGAMPLSPHPEVTQPLENDQLVLWKYLANYVQNDPHRFQYRMTVNYLGRRVLEKDVDLGESNRNGVRLMYGDDMEQLLDVAAKRVVPDEFQLPGISLPPCDDAVGGSEEDRAKVRKILNNLKLGVIFTANENGDLLAERICKSWCFFYPQNCPPARPTKMKRGEFYPLFSYDHYLNAHVDSKFSHASEPVFSAAVFFGAEPHNFNSIGLVNVTLTSLVAEKIGGGDKSLIGNSLSLSIETHLRDSFHGMAVDPPV